MDKRSNICVSTEKYLIIQTNIYKNLNQLQNNKASLCPNFSARSKTWLTKSQRKCIPFRIAFSDFQIVRPRLQKQDSIDSSQRQRAMILGTLLLSILKRSLDTPTMSELFPTPSFSETFFNSQDYELIMKTIWRKLQPKKKKIRRTQKVSFSPWICPKIPTKGSSTARVPHQDGFRTLYYWRQRTALQNHRAERIQRDP